LSSAGKRTARFLLAGACDSYRFLIRSLRWLETPLYVGPVLFSQLWKIRRRILLNDLKKRGGRRMHGMLFFFPAARVFQ